jgi:predicted SnoaL-like aldol condensation-catalyzing enzyme
MPDSKQTALEFYELAFVKKNPAEAAERFFGPEGYKQHNPMAPDGGEAFVKAISGLYAAFPDFSTESKRVIAEGDLVAIHHHVHMTKDDAGQAVVDIFRISNGKVVEHWDVVQPVPDEAQNGNTMF